VGGYYADSAVLNADVTAVVIEGFTIPNGYRRVCRHGGSARVANDTLAAVADRDVVALISFGRNSRE